LDLKGMKTPETEEDYVMRRSFKNCTLHHLLGWSNQGGVWWRYV